MSGQLGILPPLVLDLCAGSGAWSEPYVQAGYQVVRVDLPRDVRLLRWTRYPGGVRGMLLAPPCTAFSYARNRYPATPDELRAALSVVDACLRAVMIYRPEWWALENPRNLLRHYLGPAAFEFCQWEFGDHGHKPTCLWGEFKAPQKSPGPRIKPSTWKTSQENARPEDSITPPRFARAFFEANP